MSIFLFWWSIATLCFAVILTLQLAIGNRRVAFLSQIEPAADAECPLVSIIVPARNEERDVEQALTSLLELDYPQVELIVVNDRSTDRTEEILADMAQRYPELRVIHLTELPDGWLGKNYALAQGANEATGQLLLFTDADVVMDPTTLRRAIAYMRRAEADHLAMTPEVRMPTRLLEAFVVTFTIFFSAYVRPWKVRDPDSTAHIGIGAFNLIRADVYQQIGTHEAIRMRPDDDLKLGKLVKLHAHRQDVVNGRDVIHVRWYASVRELIDGLMKNAFSGADYRLGLTAFAAMTALTMLVWPFAAVWLASPPAQWIYGLTILILLLLFADAARAIGARWWLAPLFPIGVLMFVYIQWRAVALTYIHQGIYWRGTHYALEELRANKV